MAFNLRPFGNIIASLMYGDLFSVLRLGVSTDAYGATIPDSREVVLEDIAGKFSLTDVDGPADTNEISIPILKRVILHTSLDNNIKAGDYIYGLRKDLASGINQVIEGICGEPNRFDTHQEIPIQVEGNN